MSLKSICGDIVSALVLAIGKIHWRFNPAAIISLAETATIRADLTQNYYIILTRKNYELSTYFTNLAEFFLSGRWGYWSHALMNCEDAVLNDGSFRLVEATGKGTHFSLFEEVFIANSVALLKPKSMSLEYWTAVFDRLKSDIGKPYDTLFDLSQDQKLSCVELVRNALMAEPNYAIDFANFEALIKKHGKLSPDMFAACADFELVYVAKH